MITTNLQVIQREIEFNFSKLYTTKINDSLVPKQTKDFQNFIETLDLPKLSNDEQAELERVLTLEEVKNTLLSFEKNKNPGEDGFTKDFYETFLTCCVMNSQVLIRKPFAVVNYQFGAQ